jgi:hypothetical protein
MLPRRRAAELKMLCIMYGSGLCKVFFTIATSRQFPLILADSADLYPA